MLHALVERASPCNLTVLLRPQTLNSPGPVKKLELEKLRALGVRFLSADLGADPVEVLSASLASFHTVIGCTGFASGAPIKYKICQAVLGAGVARYVPWQFGVDYDLIGRGSAQDLFDEQLDVRDLLRSQSKTEWVIISTGIFTSFLFEPAVGVLDSGHNTVRALGSVDTAITVTTAEDIGRLTAEILLAEPRIRDTVMYTAGDTITYRQLAEIVENVLGHPVDREEWSVAQLEEALLRDADNAMRKYRVMFAKGVGVSWKKDQTFNARHGLATTSVEHWARKT